jgi:hypothetical protein
MRNLITVNLQLHGIGDLEEYFIDSLAIACRNRTLCIKVPIRGNILLEVYSMILKILKSIISNSNIKPQMTKNIM